MTSVNQTCLCCQMTFTTTEDQRIHYKSEWHRYNLKRKVAQLKPINEDDFKKLEAKHRQDSQAQGSQQDDRYYCRACGKLFINEHQWQNHGKSGKHIANLKKIEASGKSVPAEPLVVPSDRKSEITEEDSDDWESVSGSESGEELFTASTCLFCRHESTSMEDNLKHMSVTHSFFLPDVEFIVDVEGLIIYLGEKVSSGKICLWCNDVGKSFDSIRAVQQHMQDKGHCKMRLEPGEDIAEYSEFYDYSSSYPDAGDEEDVKDNNLEVNADLELVLPSGATVGHRSLRVYYKQNLSEKKDQEAVPKSTRRMNGQQLMHQYQALGYRMTPAALVAKKARDHQFVQKRQLKLGIRGNKLQRHFRSQIDF